MTTDSIETGATVEVSTATLVETPEIVDRVVVPAATPSTVLFSTTATAGLEEATVVKAVRSTTADWALPQLHLPTTVMRDDWNTGSEHADSMAPSVGSSTCNSSSTGYQTRYSTSVENPPNSTVTATLGPPLISSPVSSTLHELRRRISVFSLLQATAELAKLTVPDASSHEPLPCVWHEVIPFLVMADVTATPSSTAVLTISCSSATNACSPTVEASSTARVPDSAKPALLNTSPATSSTFLLFVIDTMSSMARVNASESVVADREPSAEKDSTASSRASPVNASVLDANSLLKVATIDTAPSSATLVATSKRSEATPSKVRYFNELRVLDHRPREYVSPVADVLAYTATSNAAPRNTG